MAGSDQASQEDVEIFDPSKPPAWRGPSSGSVAPSKPSEDSEIYTPGQRPQWMQQIPTPPKPASRLAGVTEESADPLEKELAQIRAGRDPQAGTAPWTAGMERALNAALFNIPRHIETAALTAINQGKTPLTAAGREAYVKNLETLRAIDEARAGQSPYASTAGTGAGIVGSLAVPALGWAGRASQAGKLGAAATGAGLGAASGYLEELNPEEALTGAGVGAGVGLVTRAIPGVTSGLGRLASNIRGNAATDMAGNLTPAAMSAIQKAAPDMSVEAIQAMAPQFAATMRTKGINDAAVREAILQAQGAPLSRQLATGMRAPEAASQVAEDATEAARKAALERARALTGEAPSPEAVAQMLQESQTATHTAASQQYGRAFAQPGVFSAKVGTDLLPGIEQHLNSVRTPTGQSLPSVPEIRINPDFVQSNNALKFLEQRFAPGTIPGELDMPAMERARQALGGMRSSAQGSDKIMMQNIINGFDNHLVNSLDASLFSGNGQQAIADIKKARKMWADLQNTYYSTSDRASQVVNNALKNFQVNQKWVNGVRVPDLDPATAQAAQGVLNGNLINKPFGTALYNKLQGIIGQTPEGAAALNAHIRNEALFRGAGNDLGKISKNIDSFLDPRGANHLLAPKVFSPDQINQLQQLSQAIKIIQSNPQTARDPNIVSRTYSFLKSLAIPGFTGLFHGPVGSVVAYAAQQPYLAAKEVARNVGARTSERAGAPGTPSYIPVQAIAPFVGSLPGSYMAATGEGEPSSPTEPRPQRASGGKVSENDIHEQLVGRLMSLAEKAKKTTQKSTEPLLNAPDEAIVHALKVADNVI